jgi:hypothetical protein
LTIGFARRIRVEEANVVDPGVEFTGDISMIAIVDAAARRAIRMRRRRAHHHHGKEGAERLS